MTRTSNLDHAFLAKTGFLLGLGLFAFGVGGELLGHSVFQNLPAWEYTLFSYSEVAGLVIGFFSPWVFGVALPLLE
ncbi:DUF7860 family protein [Halapricum salinum]|uniref:Uncharacterized protein n=1 Tax=Halapricum salinum TaxID=1457250 RepID=A0A4D6HFU6_9EURY|nr:hypothetical protein [Halapricum salinum]QCC52660.1 hypothetical protein DV733_16100 [Halapricum salinum]